MGTVDRSARIDPAGCIGTRVTPMWSDGIVFCYAPVTGHWRLTIGGPLLNGSILNGTLIKEGYIKVNKETTMKNSDVTDEYEDVTHRVPDLDEVTPIDHGFCEVTLKTSR